MKKFYPDAKFKSIKEITPEFLLEKGIKYALLDIDNTLVSYTIERADDNAKAFLKMLADAGFAYARTVDAVDDIRTCQSLMIFNPNTHFMAPDFMEKFAKAKSTGMFYFWGHTYELTDDPELWEECERRIAAISADPDVEWVNVTDLAEEVKKYL